MIHRAPRHAVDVVGRCMILAGPERGTPRYVGWSEVWMHEDGKLRVAFPAMSSVKSVRNPETKVLWVFPLKNTTVWYDPR